MAPEQCRGAFSMTTIKARKVQNNMMRKGFVPKVGDHVFLILQIDGAETRVRTKISHGETEIGDRLIKEMARQIGLSFNEFIDFASCRISGEEYIGIISESEFLSKHRRTRGHLIRSRGIPGPVKVLADRFSTAARSSTGRTWGSSGDRRCSVRSTGSC